MTVLIVGGADDGEAARVAEEVRRRGGASLHLDSESFPGGSLVSFRDGEVRAGSARLEVPRAVYLRALACHPLMPGLHKELVARPRGLIAQCEEKRAMLESVVLHLAAGGARVVNSLEANAQHHRKPYQLTLLEKRGLPVPPWLATNDPEQVRSFVRQTGDTIYKPLAGGATVRRVEPEDLRPERLGMLAAAPVLFQRYVAGTPLRVYVAGRRAIAAAAIHSSEVDYRRGEDAVEPCSLTPDERRAAVAAAQACGMRFTGVDLIRRRQGFVVLECNPSPMFAVFERKTGLDVAGPLAAFLLSLGSP